MKKTKLTIFFLFFTLSSVVGESDNFRVVGYLPAYRLLTSYHIAGNKVLDPDSALLTPYDANFLSPWNVGIKMRRRILSEEHSSSVPELFISSHTTHINYFALKPNPNTGLLDSNEIKSRDIELLNILSKKYNFTKYITVFGENNHFSSIAASESSRRRFIADILQFCLKNNFQGVDYDWEFPRSESDRKNYLSLVKETRELFSKYNLGISIAVSRHRAIEEEIFQYVDMVNLMAYDFGGRHSTYESTEEALDYMLIRYKIAPQKINLGLPFYGRSFDATGNFGRLTASYRDIQWSYTPSPWVNEVEGFYFNGQDIIRQKTEMALLKRVGGVMIWEVGQDSFNKASLLKAIQEEIQNSIVKIETEESVGGS